MTKARRWTDDERATAAMCRLNRGPWELLAAETGRSVAAVKRMGADEVDKLFKGYARWAWGIEI